MNARDDRGDVMGPEQEELARTFGAALRRRRREAGLTQARLADRAWMDTRSISRFERGRLRPRWDTIQVLAQALALGRHWVSQDVERELLASAGDSVVFKGRGRALRRARTSRSIESLEREVDRQLAALAANESDPAFAERLRAVLAANEADRAARSQRDHAVHNRRSQAGPVDN